MKTSTSMKKGILTGLSWLAKTLILSFILLVGFLILYKSFEYFHPDFSHGFLSNKKEVFEGIFRWGLYAHMCTAPPLLFIASAQLFFPLHLKLPKIHRSIGKCYIILTLFVSAPSGLILSFYGAGGLSGKTAFLLLSILWWYFTYKGYKFAKTKNWKAHQQMMTRSFLLILSAVLLRIYGFISAYYFNFYDYALLAWLCWTPQLFLYEAYLLKKKFKNT